MQFVPTSADMMLMQDGACFESEPQTDGSAGVDLIAAHDAQVIVGSVTIVETEMHSLIPRGFCGLVCPRSGIAAKHGVTVVNAPGVIDSDYKDTIKVILSKLLWDGKPFEIKAGDRIAQLIFVPVAQPNSVLAQIRSGGLGSTGTE